MEDDLPPPRRRGDLRQPHAVKESERDWHDRTVLMAERICTQNIWFYRDRTGLPRGPMTMETLKKCYVNGIVDQHTLMWGDGLGDWIPLRNIRGMNHALDDPRTRFARFIVNRFSFPKAERRANRDQLYEDGLAKSPTMSKEDVRDWRKRREEALVSGEESTMLSLSLALPRARAFGRKVRGMFEKRGVVGEEEAGVRSA